MAKPSRLSRIWLMIWLRRNGRILWSSPLSRLQYLTSRNISIAVDTEIFTDYMAILISRRVIGQGRHFVLTEVLCFALVDMRKLFLWNRLMLATTSGASTIRTRIDRLKIALFRNKELTQFILDTLLTKERMTKGSSTSSTDTKE